MVTQCYSNPYILQEWLFTQPHISIVEGLWSDPLVNKRGRGSFTYLWKLYILCWYIYIHIYVYCICMYIYICDLHRCGWYLFVYRYWIIYILYTYIIYYIYIYYIYTHRTGRLPWAHTCHTQNDVLFQRTQFRSVCETGCCRESHFETRVPGSRGVLHYVPFGYLLHSHGIDGLPINSMVIFHGYVK